MRTFLLGEDEPGYTRSEAERRMRKLMRAARLPVPVANARVAGRSVDFVWRQQRLVVEVDSYQYHGHRAAFERDRRKDVALRAAGYRVVRITWWQLRDEPFVVVAHIARMLERVP
jgi:very-short-patch-repair endonuclease